MVGGDFSPYTYRQSEAFFSSEEVGGVLCDQIGLLDCSDVLSELRVMWPRD